MRSGFLSYLIVPGRSKIGLDDPVQKSLQRTFQKSAISNALIGLDDPPIVPADPRRKSLFQQLQQRNEVSQLPPRENMKDAKVNGYDIPAKTMIYVDVYSIGRDPKYWEDSEVFWHERFENSSINFKGSNLELIPFGAGRRLCPGITLAMVNVELAFANMLYKFNWTLPDGMTEEDVDLRPKPRLTTPKLIPLVLVATPAFTK
ncbi:hypothetical protein KFK09_029347 [Dendrobium nobile]|uniref:Cytochrome P450 n=1 Tax=Dendrobium nobile TaxID=94219 RepID=A0A8T3A0V0_DENNO|nr:hypothetical protein KFK09_029347 [Dendrobium nobile]